jgi:hypothetical protein
MIRIVALPGCMAKCWWLCWRSGCTGKRNLFLLGGIRFGAGPGCDREKHAGGFEISIVGGAYPTGRDERGGYIAHHRRGVRPWDEHAPRPAQDRP